MKKNKTKKGFTLIELLIVTGIIAIATVGVYAVANIGSDWRKSSAEVQALSNVIVDIDNATATTGDYTGITLAKLPEMTNKFSSALALTSVNSPSTKVLHFNYKDLSSRVCNDFSTKMLSSKKNITAIVNGQNFDNSSFGNLVVGCNNDKNDVTVVINKVQDDYTVGSVVASINPPATPAPDIVIPTFGGPTPLPVVPGFVPGPTAVIPGVPTSNPVAAIINPTAPGLIASVGAPAPPPKLVNPPTYATQYCWNGQVIYPNTICPIQTKTCWDGSVIPVTNSCPAVPPPPPPYVPPPPIVTQPTTPTNPADPGGQGNVGGQPPSNPELAVLTREIPFYTLTGNGYQDTVTVRGYFTVTKQSNGSLTMGAFRAVGSAPSLPPQGGYGIACGSCSYNKVNNPFGTSGFTISEFNAISGVQGIYNSGGSGGA